MRCVVTDTIMSTPERGRRPWPGRWCGPMSRLDDLGRRGHRRDPARATSWPTSSPPPAPSRRTGRCADGDVLVVTQKVVSKAEGRLVAVDPDDPLSHKGLVEDEAVRILRRRGDLVITETRHGFVCANSGVDLSNVERGEAALLPLDSRPLGPPHPRRPAGPARRRGRGHRVATRSGGRGARGLTDVAIGVAGIAGVVDLRGSRGRPRARDAGDRGGRGRRAGLGGRAGDGQVERHPGRRGARRRGGVAARRRRRASSSARRRRTCSGSGAAHGADAVGQRRPRRPAEVDAGPHRRDARSGPTSRGRHGARLASAPPATGAAAPGLVCAPVPMFTTRPVPRAAGPHEGVDGVVDVEEVARLAAVAVDRARLPGRPRRRRRRPPRRRRPLARPVDVGCRPRPVNSRACSAGTWPAGRPRPRSATPGGRGRRPRPALLDRQLLRRHLAVQRQRRRRPRSPWPHPAARAASEHVQAADERPSPASAAHEVEHHLGPAPGQQLGQLGRPHVEVVELELAGAAVGVGPRLGQVGQRAGRQVVDRRRRRGPRPAAGRRGGNRGSRRRRSRAALTGGSGTRTPSSTAPPAICSPSPSTTSTRRAPAPTDDAATRGSSRRPRRRRPRVTPGSSTDADDDRRALDAAAGADDAVRTTAPSGRRWRRARAGRSATAGRTPSRRSRLAWQVLVGPAGVEPVVVGGQREQRAVGDHGRERLPLDRHPPAGRDAVEHRRLEHVGAGVDEVGRRRRRAAASR